ncbi:hypothetical protein DYB25_013028 [Aphanomyces astaci]|uniref:DOT1 domain-containing protein n=2 Tax=Aphanomyces astaci TaxID=112090 RepID=A0A397BMG9_APHAT|nr:hypothetical protein DYB36_013502 [Aphanomyces astaci]RHY27855.1 hypothetical protein DYB25_013028 [Aphanomyces astaci]
MPIDGSLTHDSFNKLFDMARLNETSIFLDVGCSSGRACLQARHAYKCSLVLGIEVIGGRLISAFETIKRYGLDRIFMFHLSAEHFKFFDPATQVYLYARGMPPLLLKRLEDAIMASASVRYVIASFELKSSRFILLGTVTTTMFKGSRTTKMFVFKWTGKANPNHAIHPAVHAALWMMQLPARSNDALNAAQLVEGACGIRPSVLIKDGNALDGNAFWCRCGSVFYCNNARFEPEDNELVMKRLLSSDSCRKCVLTQPFASRRGSTHSNLDSPYLASSSSRLPMDKRRRS